MFTAAHVNRLGRGGGSGDTPLVNAGPEVAAAAALLGTCGGAPPTAPDVPDGHHGIFTIPASGLHSGRNGIHYKTDLSPKNVPAHGLSMNVARILPGRVT